MDVCYNKLFKLLIDKGMKRTDLRKMTGISPNTLTKLSNNEFVSMEVLVKICRVLDCDIGDIVEVVESLDHGVANLVASSEEQL
ncbi:MAG: helix-turn-helix domain-containing protein [Bacillota bacterium]